MKRGAKIKALVRVERALAYLGEIRNEHTTTHPVWRQSVNAISELQEVSSDLRKDLGLARWGW